MPKHIKINLNLLRKSISSYINIINCLHVIWLFTSRYSLTHRSKGDSNKGRLQAWMRPRCDRVMSIQVFEVFWLLCELKRVDQFLINFFNRPILPFTGCFERLQLAFREIDGEWRMITEEYSMPLKVITQG